MGGAPHPHRHARARRPVLAGARALRRDHEPAGAHVPVAGSARDVAELAAGVAQDRAYRREPLALQLRHDALDRGRLADRDLEDAIDVGLEVPELAVRPEGGAERPRGRPEMAGHASQADRAETVDAAAVRSVEPQ